MQLSTALAARRGISCHGVVEPNRQAAAALERLVVAGPVRHLVGRECRSAHGTELQHWVQENIPPLHLRNKAPNEVKATASGSRASTPTW